MAALRSKGVEIRSASHKYQDAILTPEAIQFLSKLHHHFEKTRKGLLHSRQQRLSEISKGKNLDFLESTQEIRDDSAWQVNPIPSDLQNRRVEITGVWMLNESHGLRDSRG